MERKGAAKCDTHRRIHNGKQTQVTHTHVTHTHMNDIAADGSKYEFKCAKLYFKLYVCMYANM